ncbi:neuronal acetylcholine receptor subunit alpha-7-like isoform X1 [Ostrea edulis]|uniref:neuronal acetylcholine receptor subunit alpha-7-like isoform X1 n=1 Tax=Ostrea edulis TaxID=37623 RepID=UPI0024AEAA86|nr:neuronal acetylcholine receptor subunit alpha-7-like isoform X1 [Ostrea edulis]
MEYIFNGIFFLSVYLSFCAVTSWADTVTSPLYTHLFTNYNPRLLPMCTPDEKVTVYMGTALRQMMNVNEKDQILKINIWLRLKWSDCRLSWNSSQFNNSHLVVPYDTVWTPDITLYDSSAEEEMMPGRTDYRATIYPSGLVYYNFPTVLQSVCLVNVLYFPMDTQICTLKFGSWSHSGSELDLYPSTDQADLTNLVLHNEWDVVSMKAIRNVLYYQCCPDPYPDITFSLEIKRKPLFYIMSILFPCILTGSVAALGFALPPESGEKVSLEVTVLLSLAVFLLMVTEQLPASSVNFPYVGMYFTTSMILVSFSCAMTVLVLNIHFRGATGNKLPDWMRRLFLNRLAWVVCVKTGKRENKVHSEKNHYQSQKEPNQNTFSNKMDVEDTTNTQTVNGNLPNQPRLPSIVTNTSSRDLLLRTGDPMLSLLTEQSDTLKKIEGHMQKDESEEQTNNEWYLLAKVLDRICLYVYIFMTILTSIIFLAKMGGA